MYNIKHALMFFFLLIERPNSALSTVYTAENLADLSAILHEVNNTDLVLFDIDYVLTVYDDKILRPCGEKLRKVLRKKLKQLEKQERDYLDSQTVLDAKIELVDSGMPAFIKEVQKKCPNVIAFTSSGVGLLGLITCQEKLKLAELRRFGIDFSNAFSTYKNLHNTESVNPLPAFYHGILFSIPDKKGESLMMFLNSVNFQPKKVIFIDDRIENIKSVESECIKKHIEFLGVHYVAAANLPGQVDEKVAYYQYDYLIKNKQWLSDEKAIIYLQNYRQD